MIDKYNSTSRDNDFHFRSRPFSCPNGQEIYRPTFDSGGSSGSKNVEGFSCLKYQQNPRRKRTKLIKVDGYGVRSGAVAKPKYGKKPDPNAPKITKPCSECGKKFWSWKALFGHMRCHPERQWRGINPPPSFKHHHHYQQQQPSMMSDTNTCADSEVRITAEDHEVATCLLMLANGPSGSESPTVTTACNVTSQGTSSIVRDPLMLACRRYFDADVSASSGVNCSRFECSSCKKVFGSHQALGGHRASHKNVRGCFAIHKNEDEEEQDLLGNDGEVEVKDAGVDDKNMNMNIHTVNEHKCSICLRVFSSGQALGGHKRCHWEKADDPSMGITPPVNPFAPKEENWALDLNLPPATVREDSLHSSAAAALDLKLGF